MVAKKSYKGQKFGMLTILEDGGGLDKVLCQCDCGNQKRIIRCQVTRENATTVSCGCYSKKINAELNKTKKANLKHGLRSHPLYNTLHAAIKRCHDSSHQVYHLYGGKGVTVCEEWRQDNGLGLKQFISDMEDTWFEGAHLDKDKFAKPGEPKCYSKETCCWITHQENNFIRRNPDLYPIKPGDPDPYLLRDRR